MNETQPHLSQLFTVYIWPDKAGQRTTDWHGMVQHVQSGAWRHFREWDDLIRFLQSEMTQSEVDTAEK